MGISTATVLAKMSHSAAIHVPEREAAAAYILDRVRPDDVIMTLGAGDGDMVGQWILDGLKEKIKD